MILTLLSGTTNEYKFSLFWDSYISRYFLISCVNCVLSIAFGFCIQFSLSMLSRKISRKQSEISGLYISIVLFLYINFQSVNWETYSSYFNVLQFPKAQYLETKVVPQCVDLATNCECKIFFSLPFWPWLIDHFTNFFVTGKPRLNKPSGFVWAPLPTNNSYMYFCIVIYFG